MKRHLLTVLLFMILVFAFCLSKAEDLSSMSYDDLLALRQMINDELAGRYEPTFLEDEMKLIDIFPDKKLASYIRDEIGAISINDPIYQEDLDSITEVFIGSKDCGVTSLEGIQYLSNIEDIFVYYQTGLKSIPDCFDSIPNLRSLSLSRCGISDIPDSICNEMYLEKLDISHTSVSFLPEDIGNLYSLKELNIAHTNIASLPESIRLLDLEKFDREGLDLE